MCRDVIRIIRAVITSVDDPRLQYLLAVGDMAKKMQGNRKSRIRQLTFDTAKFVHHICYGLVDLTRYLLGCGNDYVLLGSFSTDPLEKSFCKLREGSGGTYFITAQSVVEKVRIWRAKTLFAIELELCWD